MTTDISTEIAINIFTQGDNIVKIAPGFHNWLIDNLKIGSRQLFRLNQNFLLSFGEFLGYALPTIEHERSVGTTFFLD